MSYNGELFVKRLLEACKQANNENETPLQKYLAADLGVSAKTISNWNNGEMYPNGKTLKKIIEKYDPISLDYLFDNTNKNYIFMKRDLLDILRIIMMYDFRQRHSYYAGYDISFETKECDDGTVESTITFKLQNKMQHDYVCDLFYNYSTLQDFLIGMDSEHDPDYVTEKAYIDMVDAILNKAKDHSKIDYSKYIKNNN